MREPVRKLAHAATLLAVPFFRFLPASALLLLSAASFAAAWLLGPVLLARLARPGEAWPRFSLAASSFPFAAGLLLLSFPGRPAVAAGAIAILAAGDSAAGLFGRLAGGRRLPWNRTKTVRGSAGFVVAALPASVMAFSFVDGCSPGASLMLLAAPVLVGALVESVPSKLGDNLPVALASGFLLGALAGGGRPPSDVVVARVFPAFLVLGALGAAGLLAGSIDRAGAAAGLLLGGIVFLSVGARGFVPLGLFIVLGSAASRARQGRSGRRTARHAIANLAAPVFFAVLYALGAGSVFRAAYAGAIAAALADTLSGEIGMLSRVPPRLIIGFGIVPRGTNGGVSALGTAAGALGALVIAGSGLGLRFLDPPEALAVAGAGLAGTLFDSLLGASAERAGLLGNEEVNFLATLFGGLAAALPGIL